MDDLKITYNKAGLAMEAALRELKDATGEERAAAQAKFDEASAEFKRAEGNYEAGKIAKSFKPIADPNHLDLSDGEKKEYSLLRAINATVNQDWKGAEFERECSLEIAKRTGVEARGFYVPMDIQLMKRDFDGLTATNGASAISTDLLSGSFIDMLRNKMVAYQAGATVLSGLVGNVAIPRQTGGATFYWVGADGAPTESNQTLDQVTLTPKTGGAYTDIGRSLLKQSSIDVENFVLSDLATTCAMAIDYAAFNGTGSTETKDPTGIAKVTGIGSVVGGTNGAAPTWANIVDLETKVATANADVGRMSYVTNAKVRGKLKTTPKESGQATYIWENGELNGYSALVSNQIPSNLTKASGTGLSQIFFGNFADLLIGQWGTLDITVDPYTYSTSGAVRIVALQDIDVAVRHAESFALMADALA